MSIEIECFTFYDAIRHMAQHGTDSKEWEYYSSIIPYRLCTLSSFWGKKSSINDGLSIYVHCVDTESSPKGHCIIFSLRWLSSSKLQRYRVFEDDNSIEELVPQSLL